jgi:hypothetical protein
VRRRRGAGARRSRALVGLALLLAVGCATTRIVPVRAAGVRVDAAQGVASVTGDGVELTVQPSAWRGSPWDLPDFVTPFLVNLANAAAVPVEYDYVSFRLFDDARFQYTALAPVEVERILRWRSQGEVRLAALSSPPPVIRRQVVPDVPAGWCCGYGWGWWPGWPYYYPPYPVMSDVYVHALPMGALQPAARLEGFVYFPRLRAEARSVTLEFHHRVGELSRVLTLPFAIHARGSANGS